MLNFITWILVAVSAGFSLLLLRGQLASRLDKPRWKHSLWLFVLLLVLYLVELMDQGFSGPLLGRLLLIGFMIYISSTNRKR